MAKFCGKCGSKLDEATGLCPNCDADKLIKQTKKPEAVEPPKQEQDTVPEPKKQLSKKEAKKQRKADKKAAKKAKKKEKWASMTFGQKVRKTLLKLLMWLILIALLLISSVGALVYFGVLDIPIIEDVFTSFGIEAPKDDSIADSLDELEEIDVGEEIRNQSQVLDTIDVSTSPDVLTEKEMIEQFVERGFINTQIATTYAMDGTFFDEKTIEQNSQESHPLYYAVYANSNGYYWTIYCCNGDWSALPISYVYSGLASCEIIVSENEYLTSYDSATNSFYKIIPDESQCIVRRVSRIDAETLDSLAEKEFKVS